MVPPDIVIDPPFYARHSSNLLNSRSEMTEPSYCYKIEQDPVHWEETRMDGNLEPRG